MNCPKCGKESVKDALYCEWCGTQLNQKKTVICPKCGREGIKNALYCEWCGAQLNQKEIPSNRNMEKYVIYNSKSKFLWLVFASIWCGIKKLTVYSQGFHNKTKRIRRYSKWHVNMTMNTKYRQ